MIQDLNQEKKQIAHSIEEYDRGLNFIGPSRLEDGSWDFPFSARQYQVLLNKMHIAVKRTPYLQLGDLAGGVTIGGHPLEGAIEIVTRCRDACLAQYGMDMIVHSNTWNARPVMKEEVENDS